MIAAWKLAKALAAGNCVILKPSELTPLTTIRLARFCVDAGVPAGVVNLLTGDGDLGRALVEHPDVDKVSFTGSTAVGRAVVRASADSNLKRLSLELGKAPSIIARDTDIDAAGAGCLQGSLLNSGQVCAAYTRLFVDRRRVDEFTYKLAAAAESLKLGPGLDAETVIGPLVSSEHLDKVDRLVKTGVADGAELVTGGARADGSLSAGYFYRPTVFGGVTDNMTIAREEIFGPVLSVLPFTTPTTWPPAPTTPTTSWPRSYGPGISRPRTAPPRPSARAPSGSICSPFSMSPRRGAGSRRAGGGASSATRRSIYSPKRRVSSSD